MDGHRRRSGSEPAGQVTPGEPGSRPDPGRPPIYHIRVKGHLDDRWADRREWLSITREESGDTLLTLPVVDQAALHGLLRRLRDVGVTLVSINPAGPGQTGEPSREDDR